MWGMSADCIESVKWGCAQNMHTPTTEMLVISAWKLIAGRRRSMFKQSFLWSPFNYLALWLSKSADWASAWLCMQLREELSSILQQRCICEICMMSLMYDGHVMELFYMFNKVHGWLCLTEGMLSDGYLLKEAQAKPLIVTGVYEKVISCDIKPPDYKL